MRFSPGSLAAWIIRRIGSSGTGLEAPALVGQLRSKADLEPSLRPSPLLKADMCALARYVRSVPTTDHEGSKSSNAGALLGPAEALEGGVGSRRAAFGR